MEEKISEEIKIPVPWGQICGKWWGRRDKQPIIALHALQENCGSFDPIIPLLSVESILCLDLPGHGFSSHLPKGQCYYVVWDGVLYLRRIFKHFKWQKVKLMGHCMGAEIACLYASIYPNDVELLINLNGVISVAFLKDGLEAASKVIPEMGSEIDKFLATETAVDNRKQGLPRKDMINIVHSAYEGGLTMEGASILMRRGMKPTNKPNCYAFSRDPSLKTLNLFNWALITMDLAFDIVRKIKCPYLNIKSVPGNNYDESVYKSFLDEIKKSSSKFVFHEVQGSHHVHITEPEKVAPIINEFFDSYDK